MHQLIYSSAATVPFTENELTALLLRARANNGRLGVTGLLLHHGGSFLQVLEGSKPVLETLFQVIALDKRHHRIVNLLSREIAARQFAEWEMGFASMKGLDENFPGFSDYLRARARPGEGGDAAARVLNAFRDGRFRSHVTTGAAR